MRGIPLMPPPVFHPAPGKPSVSAIQMQRGGFTDFSRGSLQDPKKGVAGPTRTRETRGAGSGSRGFLLAPAVGVGKEAFAEGLTAFLAAYITQIPSSEEARCKT